MKKLLTIAVALATLSSLAIAGEQECLEPGNAVKAFLVHDVTGPATPEKICYRCKYGNRPVVSVFTRDVNENVTSLIKKVDTAVGSHSGEKMAAFVVLLTEDIEKQRGTLEGLAKTQKIQNTPLTIFDGVAGPPAYKITKDAEVTVMMWVGGELKVNQALKKGELSDAKIASILKETNKILN